MVNTNTKITGNSRLLRTQFYTGGENSKASLELSPGGTNDKLFFEAKNAGINGNDISITCIDSGLENTDFSIELKNTQDIVATLERDCSRAILVTTNKDVDANVKFTAVAIGTGGNDVNIAIEATSATPAVVTTCTIATKIVTITTSAVHGFVLGDVVGVTGLRGEIDVNGCFQIQEVPTTSSFKYTLTGTTTTTSATGYGLVTKADITVATDDITVASPVDSAGNPMITPEALVLAWGRFSAAKALATCEIIGTSGNKRIGYMSKTYLTKGKSPAITTTALDLKRAIEEHSTAKLLVDLLIPVGTTGVEVLRAVPKTNLTGGSNLVKVDADDQLVHVFVYDEWENVIATSDTTYISEHSEEDIDLISNITRKSLGFYECVYAPSNKYRVIFVEYKCEINGEVVVGRQRVDLEWATSDIVEVT